MTQIKMSYKGKDYILEYNRKTAKTIEDRGFSVHLLGDKPNIMIPMLFQGAFAANHKRVDFKVIEEMWDHIPNKDMLVDKLCGMYADTINTLMDSADDGDKENALWTEI